MSSGELDVRASSWAGARGSFGPLAGQQQKTFKSSWTDSRQADNVEMFGQGKATCNNKLRPGCCVNRGELPQVTRTGGKREGGTMPLYLSRFSYTPETWARLIGNPEDRRKAAQSYIESVGGKLHGFWYAFGSYDGYNLWEVPDNVSMAAVALAISGGGALSSIETTVLLTVDETMDALRKAKQVRYRAPGA